jgi:hypothetical protein
MRGVASAFSLRRAKAGTDQFPEHIVGGTMTELLYLERTGRNPKGEGGPGSVLGAMFEHRPLAANRKALGHARATLRVFLTP